MQCFAQVSTMSVNAISQQRWSGAIERLNTSRQSKPPRTPEARPIISLLAIWYTPFMRCRQRRCPGLPPPRRWVPSPS